MIRYIILALLMFFNCIFIATPYVAAKNLYNNIPGIVTKVYDGDTLTLQNNNGIYNYESEMNLICFYEVNNDNLVLFLIPGGCFVMFVGSLIWVLVTEVKKKNS